MNTDQSLRNITAQSVATKYLDKGDKIEIIINAKRKGVIVPEIYKKRCDLCLNISRKFKNPVSLTDKGIQATLSFQGESFNCFIPWDTIWCIKSPNRDYFFFKNLFREDVKLDVIGGGGFLTPPRTGHLKLVN